MPDTPSRKINPAIAYWLLATLAALLPFTPRRLPTLDGPQHLRLADFLIRMRSDPASPLHAVYEDALGLRTASLFTWFAKAVHSIVSLEFAERIWLSIAIFGVALAGWLWTRSIRPEGPARALLVAPFFINWFTTQGFLPFLGSVPLGAISVWLLLTAEEVDMPARKRRWYLASILLVLCYLGHLATLLLACACALSIAFFRRRERRTVRALLTFIPFIPALALAARASLRDFSLAVSTHGTPPLNTPHFASLPELFALPIMRTQADVGPLDRWLQRIALVLLFILLTAAARKLLSFNRQSRTLSLTFDKRDWPLLGMAIAIVGFAILPVGAAGGWHVSARLIPFMLLLIPSAAYWPVAGSRMESRFVIVLSAISLFILLSIGVSWRGIGAHLQSIAEAGGVMAPGTRVLPLVFHPGGEQPFVVRNTAILRHAWAIPARQRALLVPFGFENLRHAMVRARTAAAPPLPDGPNEFAASKLWGEPLHDPPYVFVESDLDTEDVTAAADLLVPALAAPGFLDKVKSAVLDHAHADFHYVLAIDPPPSFRETIDAKRKANSNEWPVLFDRDGVVVYRAALPLDRLSLRFVTPPAVTH